MYIPDTVRRAFDLVEQIARDAFNVREPMTVSEWAEKYRYLPQKVSTEAPGLIDLDKTPYMRWILDLACNPNVRKIVVKKCSQVGISTVMDTIFLWSVAESPCPILWICPNADLAKTASKQRIEPAAKESPATRERLGTGKEDKTTKMLNFDRMIAYFVGAGTNRSMISRPGKRVFIDDFDDCPSYTLGQAEQRTGSFTDSLIFETGVPTFEGYGIDLQYELGQKWYYACPCPHCGFRQSLEWEMVRWDGGLEADPKVVLQSAWLECGKCKGRIENHHKPAMLRKAVWQCDEVQPLKGMAGGVGGVLASDERIGPDVALQITPYMSTFQPFGYYVKGFLDAKGKPEREWWNGMQGRAVRNVGTLKLEEVKELAAAGGAGVVANNERWMRRTVPDEACVLIATVDVQADYAYVQISGMTDYGLHAFYIDHFVRPMPAGTSLDPLYQEVKNRRYQRLDGRWMKISMQVWDTGHRAIDCYAVWKSHRAERREHLFVLVKGDGSLNMQKPHRWSSLESAQPGAQMTQAQKAGARVLILNTKQWKDQVARALKAGLSSVRKAMAPRTEEEGENGQRAQEHMAHEDEPDDISLADVADGGGPATALGGTEVAGAGVMQAYYLPRDTPKDYLEHLVSEHVVKGRWEEIREHVRNEGWDCSYYLAASSDAMGMRSLTAMRLENKLTTAPTAAQKKAWGLPRSFSGGNGPRVSTEPKEDEEPATKRNNVRAQDEIERGARPPRQERRGDALAELRARLARRMRR